MKRAGDSVRIHPCVTKQTLEKLKVSRGPCCGWFEFWSDSRRLEHDLLSTLLSILISCSGASQRHLAIKYCFCDVGGQRAESYVGYRSGRTGSYWFRFVQLSLQRQFTRKRNMCIQIKRSRIEPHHRHSWSPPHLYDSCSRLAGPSDGAWRRSMECDNNRLPGE